MYTVDIAPSIRRLASNPSCPDLIVGDSNVKVRFLNGGASWPIPALGAGGKWVLCIVGRESPSSSLVDSSAWSQTGSNEITFTIDTTAYAVHMNNADSAEIILEVVKSDPANNDVQTLARWTVTIHNQGT